MRAGQHRKSVSSALCHALLGFLASVALPLAVHAATFPLPFPIRPTEFPLKRPVVTGTVVAWGSFGEGLRDVPIGLKDVVAISAGSRLAIALKSDGTVVQWGYYSQTIPSDLSDVVAISAGSEYAMALKSDGTVVAWGANYLGERSVPDGLNEVVAIAAGASRTVVLKIDGTVVTWPLLKHPQVPYPILGPSDVIDIGNRNNGCTATLKQDHTVEYRFYPYNDKCFVPPGLSDVVAVSVGGNHTAALKKDGTVVAWGVSNSSWWADNNPPGLSNVVAISAGYSHCLAIKYDGTVVAWGSNIRRESKVPDGLANVVATAGGDMFSMALVSDGRVKPSWIIDKEQIAIEVNRGIMNVNMRVVLGRKYQLQGSNDLKVWTVTGPVFVADSENVTQEFIVADVGRFFRIVEIL